MIRYTLSYVEILGIYVVVVEKKKPDWMAGKLNLPGGKVEPGESGYDAAVRELYEETGLRTINAEWAGCLTDYDDRWHIDFFRHKTPAGVWPETRTEERVGVQDIRDLPPNIMPNLRYFLPLLHSKTVFRAEDYGHKMALTYTVELQPVEPS